MFTHRLTSLIESGIPILTAMNILWRQTEDKTLQLVVSHMRKNLEEGNKISDALGDFPNVFSVLYRSLIDVAERTGTLVGMLRKLTAHLEYQKQFITRVKKATIYPLIVFTFALLVLIGMFIFIVPTFEKVLMNLDVDLPVMTQLVLNISAVMKSPAVIFSVILGGIMLAVLYKQLKKHPRFAYRFDAFKLKIPVIGNILYTISISRFVHSLSMLIGAGFPIVQSFPVAKTTAYNEKIIRGIEGIQDKIEQGVSLYDSFSASKLFPVMVVELVGVGEVSGSIVKVFERLGTHMDEEVDYKINKYLTSMEPALIIFVGGIVLMTLLAIYTPVFSIWQTLGR